MNNLLQTGLTKEHLDQLAEKAKDWALTNGFIMRVAGSPSNSDLGQIAPFTLFPTPFHKSAFDRAMAVQKDMNLLYMRVAADRQWLESSLASVVQTDKFNANLMQIYQKVMDEGPAQPISLQIQRCDYMCSVQQRGPTTVDIKQVEVNNIASSFSVLSSRLESLHRHILRELKVPEAQLQTLPSNTACETVASGIAHAWRLYKCDRAVVLVVVDNNEQNIADQRGIEYLVGNLTDGKAKSIRLTLLQCLTYLTLDDKTKQMRVKPGKLVGADDSLVAVVYFRAGYIPQHYPTQSEWDARLLLERSDAIKCPTVALHLSGTKKVQQVLAGAGVLERFLPDNAEAVARIRSTFAGLWGLERNSKETKIIVDKVRANPDNFVLKPQLEGGGNNIYGQDIVGFIGKLSPVDLEAYILMERIHPPVNPVYFVRCNKGVCKADSISELGTYGYLIGNSKSKEVVANVQGGYLLRTKAVNVDEGGIMAGASALDSPMLYS